MNWTDWERRFAYFPIYINGKFIWWKYYEQRHRDFSGVGGTFTDYEIREAYSK